MQNSRYLGSLKWETKMFMECKIQQHAKVDLGFSEQQVLVPNLCVNHALILMSSGLPLGYKDEEHSIKPE